VVAARRLACTRSCERDEVSRELRELAAGQGTAHRHRALVDGAHANALLAIGDLVGAIELNLRRRSLTRGTFFVAAVADVAALREERLREVVVRRVRLIAARSKTVARAAVVPNRGSAAVPVRNDMRAPA
jgi:hypothetical protein